MPGNASTAFLNKNKLWHHWMPLSHFGIGIVGASLFINILSLAFPIAILQIYDRIVPNNALETLIVISIGVFLLLCLELLLKVGRSIVTSWGDARLEYTIGCYAFHKMMNADLETYETEGAGKHIDRLSALSNLKEFYGGQAVSSFIDIPFLVIFIAFMSYIAGWVAFVPILSIGFLFFYTAVTTSTVNTVMDNQRVLQDRRNNFILELLSGVHTIKSHGMEALMLRRYERLHKNIAHNDFHLVDLNGSYTQIGQLVSQLNLVLVVVAAAYGVIDGQISLGAMAACTLLASRMVQPVVKLLGLWTKYSAVKQAEKQLQEIIDMPCEIAVEGEKARISGHIRFKKVSFTYAGDVRPLFTNINFIVRPGEAVCITGEGVCGKTTLLALIARLVKPTRGQVLIDKRDIAEYDMINYRSQVAYVSQNDTLFEGTLLENLTLFRKGEYAAEAMRISVALGLDEFVKQMPKGYHTKIYYNSEDILSRGVKQKIVLCRAFVGNPSIILFDEANTAIDLHSDQLLKEYLLKIKGKTTLVLVTQRPSLKKIADRTYKIHNGTLDEVR